MTEPTDNPHDVLPARPADTIPPTREAALARIARVRPDAYARTRNHLDGAVTGLSPYVTHGVVTLREVLAGVLARGALPVRHKLVFELGWREFFRHAWQHDGDRILQSLHAGPRPEADCDPVLPADIREARTGVPVVDEAVRALYANGTLHNHARMWLASYVVHLRRVHWRAGADWLVAHLLDGDLASNHLSWQWVAGTGSSRPYLFNADNVARYAPAHWHSTGSVIDRSYGALEEIARGASASPVAAPMRTPGAARATALAATAEPPLLAAPPPALDVRAPGPDAVARLRGRTVWIVHPWALRAPPSTMPDDVVIVGVYPREHHAAWPWPEARWRWVDAAMAAVVQERWFAGAAETAAALAGAALVRSVDDPHVSRWLRPIVQLDTAPALFPQVAQRCASFSQWWTRVTRGLERAEALL